MARTTAWCAAAAFGVLTAQSATTQIRVWSARVSLQADSSPRTQTTATPSTGRSPGPAISVSPARASVRGGDTRRFFAQVSPGLDPGVVWRVNGVKGGNLTTGTISAEGIFTAPALPPTGNPVAIEAVSAGDAAIVGRSVVTLLNPVPVISSFAPKNLNYGEQTVTIRGSGFVPGSQVQLDGVPLPTKFVSSKELIARASPLQTPGAIVAVAVSNPDPGSETSSPVAATVGPAHPKVSYLAAARFLEQASWGPDAESIAHLEEAGFDAWLAEQFAVPPTLYRVSNSSADNLTDQQSEFFVHALSGADQLRQRVAFALGQVFVVSGQKTGQPRQMVPYQNMLLQDAFSTYAQLLRDVTLSPTMGVYLDMVNDDKGDLKLGTSPNENYARELMQLFSIGTVGLNPDGSETGKLTYDQGTITDMARALTGWTYPGKAILKGHNPENFDGPMLAVESNHDRGQKVIVGGVVLPAGQSAQKDLEDVLRALSTHPNAPAFISLRLIQHLVTSDPSPAYRERVSRVFVSSGGDLKAVLKQTLLDPEARQGDDPLSAVEAKTGHWREPVLAVVALMRNLRASVRRDNRLERFPASLGQRVFYPESVFNDYSPLYHTASGLLAPEFELLSSGTALMRANVVRNLVEKGLNGDAQFDLSPFVALAGSPADLVDEVDRAFLYGRLPVALKPEIVRAISVTHDYNLRVRSAIYLVASSALYQVQH